MSISAACVTGFRADCASGETMGSMPPTRTSCVVSRRECRHRYLFRQLACELCRVNYQTNVILHDGTTSQLVSCPFSRQRAVGFTQVPLPETKAPYLVLENMVRIDPTQGSNLEGQISRIAIQVWMPSHLCTQKASTSSPLLVGRR